MVSPSLPTEICVNRKNKKIKNKMKTRWDKREPYYFYLCKISIFFFFLRNEKELTRELFIRVMVVYMSGHHRRRSSLVELVIITSFMLTSRRRNRNSVRKSFIFSARQDFSVE